MMADDITQITPVDPARLDTGTWCHRRQRQIGEGDISASYSADRIGMAGRVRKPFTWNGGTWVCVGLHGRADDTRAKAYRLVHPHMFEGQTYTYAERSRSWRSSGDTSGFYHGMIVQSGGTQFVLCGPPRTFVRGEAEQFSLF